MFGMSFIMSSNAWMSFVEKKILRIHEWPGQSWSKNAKFDWEFFAKRMWVL
jgi:hypothetical protein